METGSTPVLRSGEVESRNHSRINKIDLGHADAPFRFSSTVAGAAKKIIFRRLQSGVRQTEKLSWPRDCLARISRIKHKLTLTNFPRKILP